MRVPGQWMTKLEALVRRVLWLKREHPDEKVLVFSQVRGLVVCLCLLRVCVEC